MWWMWFKSVQFSSAYVAIGVLSTFCIIIAGSCTLRLLKYIIVRPFVQFDGIQFVPHGSSLKLSFVLRSRGGVGGLDLDVGRRTGISLEC